MQPRNSGSWAPKQIVAEPVLAASVHLLPTLRAVHHRCEVRTVEWGLEILIKWQLAKTTSAIDRNNIDWLAQSMCFFYLGKNGFVYLTTLSKVTKRMEAPMLFKVGELVDGNDCSHSIKEKRQKGTPPPGGGGGSFLRIFSFKELTGKLQVVGSRHFFWPCFFERGVRNHERTIYFETPIRTLPLFHHPWQAAGPPLPHLATHPGAHSRGLWRRAALGLMQLNQVVHRSCHG